MEKEARIVFAVFAISALVAFSMPTQEEIAEAQGIVGELMADHIAANKKGKETPEAVGAAAKAPRLVALKKASRTRQEDGYGIVSR